MNIEKAIRKIKEFGLHHAIQDLPHSESTVKAFEMAISALEKQMPKKIKKFTYPKNIVYMYCPECDEGIDENNLFCSRCGQKIDWEVENE
jgi:RNA polymerase-binding transcription factor DksA